MTRRLVVLGDTLLDSDILGDADRLCPDAPVPVVDQRVVRVRPGGAGLAALLAAGEADVTLITAIGADDAGDRARALLQRAGVRVVDVAAGGRTVEKTRVVVDGRTVLRLDRNTDDPPRYGALPLDAREALCDADGVLVADYGLGLAGAAPVRAALRDVPARTPVVWDPHPRGAEPIPGVRLVTPNVGEARAFAPGLSGDTLPAITRLARALIERWKAAAVAVTMSSRGALLVQGDSPPAVTPAPFAAGGDPCGAGDRFASAAALRLAEGALVSEAVSEAVWIAAEYVASGGAAALGVNGAAPPSATAATVVARTRARGGTVVATGGCFDIVHAGHVGTLRAARNLGDCLVVLLNSDASVRRLKGPGRPVVRQDDRAAVLRALDCVDAVEIFDEDTPEAALERLRPDIFAKGGDYAVADLPEAAVLARWGGQAVTLPYLEGRSTTRILREVIERDSR